jgi:hypothetical protein
MASIPASSSFKANGSIPHNIAAMRDKKNPVVFFIAGLCMNRTTVVASIAHNAEAEKTYFRKVNTEK